MVTCMVTLSKVDWIEPGRGPAFRVPSELPLSQGQDPEIQPLNLDFPPRRHRPWPLAANYSSLPINTADTNPGGNILDKDDWL